MTMDNLRYLRGKVIFYRKEIESLKARRQELAAELTQKGIETELTTSIIGLDEMREQTFAALAKQYEDLIFVLETIANVPTNDRLPIEKRD